MSASLSFLHLLHLADSALPVGAAAHSFGMETLVLSSLLDVERLPEYLHACIEESVCFESWYVRAGHRCAVMPESENSWTRLNSEFSAFRVARESRRASLLLGRRLLHLFETIAGTGIPAGESHYCIAFGYVAGRLGLDERDAALAFAQQSVSGMLSCAQRLLPLGQQAAQLLAWQLKPVIAAAIEASSEGIAPFCSTPLLEIGSMQHARLDARLFIS